MLWPTLYNKLVNKNYNFFLFPIRKNLFLVSSSPDKVPMARIISTNLNSAPEIRLGDTTLTPAPSLNQVQGKDWTELKSPPRFDSFRLVTQVRNHYDALLSGLKYLKNIFKSI